MLLLAVVDQAVQELAQSRMIVLWIKHLAVNVF